MKLYITKASQHDSLYYVKDSDDENKVVKYAYSEEEAIKWIKDNT